MTKEKWQKVLVGAVIALCSGGAVSALTYLQAVDWGAAGPIVAAVLAILVNLARKWLQPDPPATPPPADPKGPPVDPFAR